MNTNPIFELQEGTLIDTDEAARRLRISRDTLDRFTRAAPRNLPGAPIDMGHGKYRHLRWNPSTLLLWLEAFRKWEGNQRTMTVSAPPKRRVPKHCVDQRGDGPISFKDLRRHHGNR